MGDKQTDRGRACVLSLLAIVGSLTSAAYAGKSASDVQLYEWLGEYSFYDDGLGPTTLRIADSGMDCASPPWCRMAVTLIGLNDNTSRMRVYSVDDNLMVFDDMPAGKRDEAYMLIHSKNRIVGTSQFQGLKKRSGFYAERK